MSLFRRWLFSRKVSRVGGFVAAALLITGALAGGEAIDFETNLLGLSESICNAGNFLYGPIGWALVVCIAVYGGLATWLGWRGGVGSLIGAFVGVFFMLALPTILAALTFGDCVLTAGGGGG